MSQQIIDVGDTVLRGALGHMVGAREIGVTSVIIEQHFIWVYHRLEHVLLLISLRLLDRSLNFLIHGDFFRSWPPCFFSENFLPFSTWLHLRDKIISLFRLCHVHQRVLLLYLSHFLFLHLLRQSLNFWDLVESLEEMNIFANKLRSFRDIILLFQVLPFKIFRSLDAHLQFQIPLVIFFRGLLIPKDVSVDVGREPGHF